MQPIHLESPLGLGQTLSKNNNEIKASTRDTKFVPEVQLTTKVAYVEGDAPTTRCPPSPRHRWPPLHHHCRCHRRCQQ
jgi:hypothetical protein